MHETLPERDVVLLGVGHTNAHVLRMWRMQPIPQTRLTCVSNFDVVTYSGMLPGVLSGQYSSEQMEIDLVRACVAANARLIVDEVVGLDCSAQRLLFRSRPPLPYDALSIGVGSVPSLLADGRYDATLLPIKPMQTFLSRLHERLRHVQEDKAEGDGVEVVVVGGGAGGVEITLCLQRRLASLLGSRPFRLTLLNGGQQMASGALNKTVHRLRRLFEQEQIQVLSGVRATEVREGRIQCDDGRVLPADVVLWATNAVAPAVLENLPLDKDERGFLEVEPTLQSRSDKHVFVVGDTASFVEQQIPKAGVYAVRQGPVLWDNLRRLLRGDPLRPYKPQSGFLKLLNTGDGKAIAEYKGMSLYGGWCWKLKNAIDTRFMDKYQEYSPMPMTMMSGDAVAEMRCAGCGGKIAGSVLSRVLAQLEIPKKDYVLVGLDQPDDAAVLQPNGDRPLTVTADFFAAPVDDPYFVGRIAMLNAVSDVFAMRAKPLAALALVTLPVGKPHQQEQLLLEIMSGSMLELNAMGATLVGGHTIEGPHLSVGFTVLADQVHPISTKGGLQVGDKLILTKPLGSGVLLAAHMQARCRASWMSAMRASMLVSNYLPASVADKVRVNAMTDVTGFGLAGHLLEMLSSETASSGERLGAVLNVDQIPRLAGFDELSKEGVSSTLEPANRSVETEIACPESIRAHPGYLSLFDPQTCGGMLLGVPPNQLAAALDELTDAIGPSSAVIGEVVKTEDRRLQIV